MALSGYAIGADVQLDIFQRVQLTAAAANTNQFEIFTCWQQETALWVCSLETLTYTTFYTIKKTAYTKATAPATSDFTANVSFTKAAVGFNASAYTKTWEATGAGTAQGTTTGNAVTNTSNPNYTYPTKGNVLSNNMKIFDTYSYYKRGWFYPGVATK